MSIGLIRGVNLYVVRSPRMREIGVRSPVGTDSVVKTGNDNSTAKHSATDECHGSSEMTLKTDAPSYSRCRMLKNPHCSMAMSTECRSKLQPFTGNGDVSI